MSTDTETATGCDDSINGQCKPSARYRANEVYSPKPLAGFKPRTLGSDLETNYRGLEQHCGLVCLSFFMVPMAPPQMPFNKV